MDDLRRNEDQALHAFGPLARRLEEVSEHGDVHEDRYAAGIRGLLLVVVPADEQALPRAHDGLRVDLRLLDGRNAVVADRRILAVVLVVLHADRELVVVLFGLVSFFVSVFL